MKTTNAMRGVVGTLVMIAVLLLGSRPAFADPIQIGDLSFTVYDFDPTGGFIGITNLSAGPFGVTQAAFEQISVNLSFADGSGSEFWDFGMVSGSLFSPSFFRRGSVQNFVFSSLSPTGPANSIALDLPDVSLFSGAYLSLLFQSTLIENTTLAVLGNGAISPIMYDTARVPEPGTLLLLACGMGVALMTRRRGTGLAHVSR